MGGIPFIKIYRIGVCVVLVVGGAYVCARLLQGKEGVMCLPWLFGGGDSGPEHRALLVRRARDQEMPAMGMLMRRRPDPIIRETNQNGNSCYGERGAPRLPFKGAVL